MRNPNVEIREGDGIEELLKEEEESIDVIITDPPYLREYLHLYEDTAMAAKKVLKKGGSLLIILPHYAIPYVTLDMSVHLRWHWLISMDQARYNKKVQITQYGVFCNHKPIGWFTKGYRDIKGRKFIPDRFDALDENDKNDHKEYHKWGQPLTWARFCLRVAPVGGRVFDPFVGGGTTALAAYEGGFPFVGVDSDPESVEKARMRLRTASHRKEGTG